MWIALHVVVDRNNDATYEQTEVTISQLRL
jgi:hypothetical protein